VDNELNDALASIADDPCAECGETLGNDWTVRLRADGERQERVHQMCAGGPTGKVSA
jgi:hypothetical protein